MKTKAGATGRNNARFSAWNIAYITGILDYSMPISVLRAKETPGKIRGLVIPDRKTGRVQAATSRKHGARIGMAHRLRDHIGILIADAEQTEAELIAPNWNRPV